MKKVFSFVAIAAAMLIAGQASAQMSVNAGFLNCYNNTQTKLTNPLTNNEVKTDSLLNGGIGVYAGLSYNIQFTEHWSVAPGVYFNYSGRIEENILTTKTTNMVDINIPVLFTYKVDFTNSFGIMGFLGPNFRYGLSAKSAVKTIATNTTETIDLYKENSFGHSPLTRPDLGLTIGVGVHFNAFQIQTGFNFGLLDRDPSKSTTQNFHQYFAGVGFVF